MRLVCDAMGSQIAIGKGSKVDYEAEEAKMRCDICMCNAMSSHIAIREETERPSNEYEMRFDDIRIWVLQGKCIS